jgi:hypothetical protein
MKKHPERPYWLGDGTERCGACTHGYVYEMEYRCVACDRGVCCHCVRIHATTAEVLWVLCPECEADEREGEV